MQLLALSRRRTGPAAIFGMIFLNERADQFGIEHPLAQAVKNAAFHLLLFDRAVVAVAAAIAGAAPRPIFAAGANPSATTNAAPRQAGQKMAGAPGIGGGHALVLVALGNGRIPKIFADDSQIGHRLTLPFAQRVRPDQRATCSRIDDLAGPIVHEPAGIEPVLENAVLALAVTGDRAGPPCPAVRTGHTLGIQTTRDHFRALAAGKFREDPQDDRCLVRIDLSQAADEAAGGIEPIRGAIAIGQSGRCPAFADGAALPALDLRTGFFPETRVHRPLDRAGDVVDRAVVEREQSRAGKFYALANSEAVALVTAWRWRCAYTLEPGDIIATGTPPGVGVGIKPDPVYLAIGDEMKLGIAGLGEQRQLVIARNRGAIEQRQHAELHPLAR